MFNFWKKPGTALVIVGLGNPGKEYENTRHNVGFRAIDSIARDFDVEIKKSRFSAYIEEIKDSDKKVILAKPLTYMNNSGGCIKTIVNYYRVAPEQLVVIYDDIDLPVGALRIRQFGGAGTHNGMRSIVDALGSDRFPRIRIGIGKPQKHIELKDYVLTGFSGQEKPVVNETIASAAKAAMDIVRYGVEKSMNMNNPVK